MRLIGRRASLIATLAARLGLTVAAAGELTLGELARML